MLKCVLLLFYIDRWFFLLNSVNDVHSAIFLNVFCLNLFFTISKTQWLYLKAHSSVERAGLIACIKMRSLPTDEDTSLRGQTLRDAIDKDRAQGLIPIYVSTSLLKGF